MADRPVRVRRLLPGVAVLVAIAVVAHWLGARLPVANALVLAVGIGAVLGNTVGVPDPLRPGFDRHTLLLETGIVLLGASIALDRVIASGPALIGLVVGTVVFGILLVEFLSRSALSLPPRSGSLLAAGASICGVSAVIAVGRSIDADRETLAYVVGAILLFDAITLAVFPVVGGLLDLPDHVFGIWAGLAMFSTGPVAAAGFAYSVEAGQWATLTKLVRNALIGALAVGYTVAYTRRAGEPSGSTGITTTRLWGEFPKFLVGFLLVAVIANVGVLPPTGLAAVNAASEWLFAIAFVGLGFSIRFEAMRPAGLAPIAVLGCYLLTVATLALVAVRVVV
jgi:uncharacterized integral membrane protein (TIGR00698 family)